MGVAASKLEGPDRAFRRGLMLYGSTAAIAAAMMVADGGLSPVFAQSIGPRISPTEAAQGSFSVPGGTPVPFFESRSDTLDIVNVNRDAVLNWTPYDGANNASFVNFLPKDTELRFVGNGETFTVINRIITADNGAGAYRPIAIQGTVSSYLFGDGPNSVGPQGGNVWFYSPGGILATGTAAFNVGSLLLSTSDFVNANNYSNYSVASFSGVADPMAKVSLLPGAQVNLPQPGSSLVIFSPSIDQGGTVTVNGSVAYISAVRADVSISGSGDIFTSIYEDAVAGNLITHTGTTTGPASIGTQDFSVFDPQTIEFLGSGDVGALLSGSIGYAAATDAMLMPNGSIRLSIGSVESDGNLELNSNTTINAPGSVSFVADAGETITGGSDVDGGYGLTVTTPTASFGAASGGTIDFAGNVEFQSNAGSIAYTLFADGVSGMLPGGSISVGGDLVMDATAGRSGSGEPIGSATGTITDGGSISVGGSLRLVADSYATETMVGTAARGGTASFTVTGANSSLMVGGALEVSADALPFTPFCECSAPSGFGDAGNATFTVDAGMVTAGNLIVTADATAHFNLFNIDGLTDFHATAGNAWVDLGNSTASFGSIDLSASALGARGVDGLTGGVATGGDVRFAKGSGGSLTTGSLQFAANATGGKGGDFSGSTGASGSGGMAQGGSITATLLQSGGGLSLFGMRANGTGGAAGDIVESSGIDGGSGGEGRGGITSLFIGGAGTILGGISEGVISASGTGGAGGYGTESDGFGPAGTGGAGGIGRGGALSVEVGTGAEFALEFSLSAAATGGAGGAGGNGAFGQPDIVPPAAGGHGGDVFGGSVSLLAAGGTISGQLELDVGGSAGAGGTNGYDAFENYTGEAPYGYATGGAITLETSGASGLFSLGYATLLASADAAGSVDLINGATGTDGGMSFGSLYIDAQSSQAMGVQNVTLSSVANTIFAGSSTDIYADAIGLDFAGGSGLSGQGISLGAYRGAIALTNTTGGGDSFIAADSYLNLYASGDITAGAGTSLSGDYGSFVRSNGGNIMVADITGGSTTISARGSVELGDATIGGTLNLLGGLEDFDGIQFYHPEGNVTVTGSVSTDYLAVASGGTTRFAGGSAVASNDAIEVRTGDDIIVESGASLVSDIAPNLGSTIFFYAGDINLGGMNGDLVDPILTPIASVVVRGSLNSNGHGVFLTGDAVDATGSTILTGDLLVDVTDVPSFGPLSSDGGLLTAGCLQGSACLGNLSASSEVSIGLDSADLQTLRIGSLSFTGTTFRARAADTISLGTSGIPSSLDARSGVALTSLSGDIALTDISVSAASINLSAENGNLLGNGNLSSVNEIVLGIGGSISAGQITTGATIVREPEGASPFLAGGDFIVAGLETGGGSPIAIEAAGNISIGLADPNGAAITLTGQSVQLVQSSTDTASIALSGSSVQFGALNATGPVSIGSSVGSIAGSGPGSINAGGAISLNAKTALTAGNLVAGAPVDAVAGTSATLGAITTTAGGVTVSAGNGLVVGAVQTANTGALDDIRLTGESISTGALTSGDNIVLSALFPMMTSGSGNYSARLGISANAGGNFATLNAGTFIDISGGSISLQGANAGTSLDLVTSAGSVTALGPLSAGSTATLAAQQALNFGSLTAAGNVSATAGINLAFASVQSSGGNVSLAGGPSITGSGPGSVIAAGTVSINSAQALSVGAVQAGGAVSVMAGTTASLGNISTTLGGVTASAGSTLAVGSIQTANTSANDDVALSASGGLTTGALTSGDNIALSGPATVSGNTTARLAITANGGGSFGSLSAGTSVDVSGGAIALSGAAAGTSLRLATPSGNLTATGPLAAGTTADLSSQGNIGIGALTAGGNIVATARNDLAFSAVSSTGGTVALTSQQNGITGSGPGSISAAGAVTLNANTALVTGAVQAGGSVTGTAGSGNSALGAVSTTSGSVNLSTSGTLSVASAQTANTSGIDDIVLAAAIGLSTGTLNAGDDIRLTGPVNATGNYTARLGIIAAKGGNFRTLNAGTAIDVSGGPIALTGAMAGTSLRLAAMSGGLLATGPLSAGTTATLSASNGIAIGALTAGGNTTLNAGGTLAGTDWSSGGSLSLTGSALTVGNAAGALGLSATIGGAATFASLGSSGGAVSLSAAGNVAGGNITAAGTVSVSGAAVTVGDLTAGTGLSVDADSFDGDDLVAGADFALTADAGATMTSAVAGTTLSIASGTLAANTLVSGDSSSLTIGGLAELGSMTAGDRINLATGLLVAGTLDAGTVLDVASSGAAAIAAFSSGEDAAIVGGTLTLGTGDSAAKLSVRAIAGDLSFDGLEAGGNALFEASGAFVGGTAVSGGNLVGRAGGDATFVSLSSTAGSVDFQAGGSVNGGDLSAGTDISLGGGAATLGSVNAGGAIQVDVGALDADSLDAGSTIDVLAAGAVGFASAIAGGDIAIDAGAVDAGTARSGGTLVATADGSVRFGTVEASSALRIEGASIDAGAATSGGALIALGDGSVRIGDGMASGDLTVDGSDLDLGDLAAGGDLLVTGDGSVKILSGTAGGDLVLLARELDAVALTIQGAADVTVDGSAAIGLLSGDIVDLKSRALAADSLQSTSAMAVTVEDAADIATARAGGSLMMRAGALTAGTLRGDGGIDVATSGSLALGGFTAPSGATFAGAEIALGNGEVTGLLAATSSTGDLSFTALDVSGDIELLAAQGLIGGNALATSQLQLRGATIAVGNITGGTGISATTPGVLSFYNANSGAGSISLDADGAVSGVSARAAGAVSISGASVALGSAFFGSGLTLSARTGDVTGAGLYQGTGAIVLQAAQDIAIGSVDSLGGVTLDASRDLRFTELRSTDGNVSARAAGVISGSTVAATGSDAAGEDTVLLVAGGDLTLTGTVTALNARSFAQDDFSAEAGGTLSIAGVEAQRDLVLKAGAGTLSAANISSGRDLALTAPTVRIDDANVAGNLTVSATGGDITGAGTTTAAGAIALTASGGIAVGNIAANGGGIAADAGGTIAFGNLAASGPVMLVAASGISATGSIASGGGVVLATETGATVLRDIMAAGSTSLSGGGSLTVNDVTLSTGSLTVSYDGEIVLRNARSAANIAIDGGAGVAFASLDAGNGVDLDAAGAIAGGAISAGQAARVEAGASIGLTGLAAANASMVSQGGPVSASGVSVSGLLDVEGTSVTLAAPGALEVQARAKAGALSVTTAGDLRIDGQATGDITLASTGGSVIIGAVGQQNLTDNSNAIGTQALGGGAAIAISAANGISVSDTLTAAGALGLTAGGLVALDGATTGQTIAVQSGDLAIGANGSLGQASTQRVSLSSTNAVNLGSGATGGFAVDAGEFGRIASGGDLLVTALAGTGTGAGSITVGALSVNAGNGGQIGTSGTFSLTSAGLLDVNNTLSIGQAGSGNTLMLTGDAVDLDYANAALSVLDAASASTGRIIVNGRLITSLSAAAAADIVGKTPAEISTRLGQADVTRTIGLFRAGNLTLEGRDAILIQNSGGNAVDDRRGLTVGSLTVTGAPDGRTLVVINGVIGTATGNNAAQIVTVTTPIAAGSSFNGCVLATAADCLAVAPPPVDPVFAPGSIVNETSDLIKKEEEEDEVQDGVADGKNDAPPIDTRFIDDPAGRPMLDDPVTGAGNEDLWQPPEE